MDGPVNGIWLKDIGIETDYTNNDTVAELRITVDRRDVSHDGYCSDPGEDVGEWKYDLHERYTMNADALDKFKQYVKDDDTVELTVLQKLYDTDKNGCDLGSNYCGYESSRRVKDGWIVYKDELDRELKAAKEKWVN